MASEELTIWPYSELKPYYSPSRWFETCSPFEPSVRFCMVLFLYMNRVLVLKSSKQLKQKITKTV